MAILKEQVAIVTGGNRGIGKATAVQLAKAGAHVVICGTNEATLAETADAIQKEYGSCEYHVADISVQADVQRMVDAVMASRGRIDILVNNAGITKDNLLVRMSEEEWDRVIEINLKGTFHTTKAVLKPMMKARYGRIVNVSSVVGVMGNPGQANYAASKAGMIGFSKSVAREVASRNIGVNVVAPGYVETDMTKGLEGKTIEYLMNSIPMKRLGQADDIAGVILFLTSAAASYITGQVIHVDGGMVMS